MQLKAVEINKIIQGQLIGNTNEMISSFSNIKDAKKGDITFLSDILRELVDFFFAVVFLLIFFDITSF